MCVRVCICVCMLILVSSSSYFVRIVVITSRTSGDRMLVALARSAGPGYYLSHYLPFVVRGVTGKDGGRREGRRISRWKSGERQKRKSKSIKDEKNSRKPGIWIWSRSLKSSTNRVHTYIQRTSTLGRMGLEVDQSFLHT